MAPATLAVIICSLLFAFVPDVVAADAVKEATFNIPADTAVKALKQFSAQSGQQLLYSNADLAGVTTNEVKGKLSVNAALDRLLAGTPLVASRDSKNGAVAVARTPPESPDPNGQAAAQTSDRREKAIASELAPTKAAMASETITLTPFQVSTDRDVGFVAASSLAGGRLSGDLKDTPVAYSVQTREFIDALILTNISEASQWTVNSANVVDYGAAEVFGATTQISIRGGGSAATQRDFFPFAVNYDSYNLERIDYARGPNAVLFGNGDYSGTINAVSRFARTDRNFGDLKVSYGSWNNARMSVDANAALNKKVGVRLDAVYQDRDGWRKFERERKKAATLATTINITQTTQLRLQAEIGSIQRNTPFTTFFDRFSGWDGATVLTTLVPTAGLPADANAKGYRQYGSATTPVFMFAPAFGGTLDISRTAQTLGGNSSATVPVGGVLVVGPTANIDGQPFNEALNLPPSRLDKVIAGSKFRYPSRTYAVSTNNPSFVQDFRSFSGFFTQRIGDSLFASVEGNYSKERRPTEYINNRGTPFTFIDINQNLPSGAANPEFLQPYNEGYRLRFKVGAERKSARAALAYVAQKTKWATSA